METTTAAPPDDGEPQGPSRPAAGDDAPGAGTTTAAPGGDDGSAGADAGADGAAAETPSPLDGLTGAGRRRLRRAW
ncbi:MAG TPA: hypothetical protein VF743_04370, partial [Acidimicrobiales bacterium]